MRALACLDPGTSFERMEQVTGAAGLDAVVVPGELWADRERSRRLTESPLRVVVNLPIFFDQALLESHPECYATTTTGRRAVADWLHMACPSSERYWELRSGVLAAQLATERPDMVSLDFARTFVRWEEVAPGAGPGDIEHGCVCDACTGPATEDAGSSSAAARRADLVTRRVAQACALVRSIHPDVPVAVKVVPWLETDHGGARTWAAGQDVRRLAAVADVVMPMSYSAMLGRPAQHVRQVHRELVELTGLPVVPWLQAAEAELDRALPLDQLVEMLDELEQDAELGYCVFHLDGIADRDDVLDVLARRPHRPPATGDGVMQ